jgi:hypothetical protein
MKLPKWDGVARPEEHLFSLACFVVGYAVLKVLTLGRVEYDDRDGPGWNPVSRMPDGRLGLSESAISGIGFASMAIGLAALLGLGLLWNHFRLS